MILSVSVTVSDQQIPFCHLLQVFYNEAKVKQVDVPSLSGSFGILPDHVPLLAVLKPGLVRVTEDDGSQKKYIGVQLDFLFSCRLVQTCFTSIIWGPQVL